MHDHFFLIWLTCTLIIVPTVVPALWAATAVRFFGCFTIQTATEENSSNALTEKYSFLERFQLLVLNHPLIVKVASRTHFETHIVDTIQRLTNVALSWKSIVGWFKTLLFGTSAADNSRTLDATAGKRNVKAIDSKRRAA